MKAKEEILKAKLIEASKNIDEAKKERDRLLSELAELAPHKVGEVVRIKRNIHAKFAVVVNVSASLWMDNIYYNYEFKAIRKDGYLSEKQVLLYGNNYEWTGEQYEEPEHSLYLLQNV